MKKLNQILDAIFIVWIAFSTMAFAVCMVIFSSGKLLGELFELYVLALLGAIVGLMLTPEDPYKGYNPEPDRSEEYEKIQRSLYDKGYDMSKDIEYSDDIESTQINNQ